MKNCWKFNSEYIFEKLLFEKKTILKKYPSGFPLISLLEHHTLYKSVPPLPSPPAPLLLYYCTALYYIHVPMSLFSILFRLFVCLFEWVWKTRSDLYSRTLTGHSAHTIVNLHSWYSARSYRVVSRLHNRRVVSRRKKKKKRGWRKFDVPRRVLSRRKETERERDARVVFQLRIARVWHRCRCRDFTTERGPKKNIEKKHQTNSKLHVNTIESYKKIFLKKNNGAGSPPPSFPVATFVHFFFRFFFFLSIYRNVFSFYYK